MDIFRGIKYFQVILVILVSLVSLTTFSSQGYCDDNWVLLNINEDYTTYYNSSSVIIIKKKQFIKVLVKKVFTEHGKIKLLENLKSINNHQFNDIDYCIILYTLQYKEGNYGFTQIKWYSKFGDIIFDDKYSLDLKDMKSQTILKLLLNKLIKKYNIKL